MVEAYPLHWPRGKSRTKNPEYARFGNHNRGYCISYLVQEITRLGGKNLIISSNLELRNDGLPRAAQRAPSDPGVAVYFYLQGEQKCMACDRWNSVEHNLWAIVKSIEAIRGLERWGSKDMVDAAFRGFQALPAPMTTEVRYFDDLTTSEEIRMRMHTLAKKLHPDMGGNAEEFAAMIRQYEEKND